MKNNKFAKTKLATSLSIVLSASVLSPTSFVYAEEAKKEVEVIQVTGIRSSLIKATDIKRESQGVVDAISAEDMGKFPDTNLAESLQRITGVSIDRVNGEGSRVTVRGFGPDFNLVTLNGRQMPTANINASSASDSRSFDFATLASEGVSSVEVYKTSKASIATGGIGSTINLVTLKPLNNPGLSASVGVKGVHDTSSEDGSSLTPELSALYSNTFADDTFGVALSLTHQNRQSGSARAYMGNGWRGFVEDGTGGWGKLPSAPTDGSTDPHVNRPQAGETYAVPQNMQYGFKEVDRTRTNGQLTLQYKPVDNLTATFDYTYSKNDVETNQNISSVWMNHGHTSSIWSEPNADGVRAPLVITENNTSNNDGVLSYADLVSQVGQFAETKENKSVGFNLEYQVTDNLQLNLDYHSSTAEAQPDSIYGNSNTIQMSTDIRANTTIDFRSDFPVVTVTYPAGVNPADFAKDGVVPVHTLSNVTQQGPEDVVTTGTSFRNSYSKSEIDQIQFDGTYVFDDGIVESIDFGIGRVEVENRNAFARAERPTWGGVGHPDDVDDALLPLKSIVDRFDNIPGDKSQSLNAYFDVDFVAFADLIGQNYGVPLNADGSIADAAWPCGTQICAPSAYTTDRRTTETSTSAYIQANLAFEIGDMPASLSIGLRHEETDVKASTLLPNVIGLDWVSDNEMNIIEDTENLFFDNTGDYSYLLPNIDFSLDVTDDIVVRASASKTLTRASYGNLTAGQSFNSAKPDAARGSRGNTGLKPIQSTNFDLSAEWYYDDASYVSVGYFRKDVKDFIGFDTVEESPYDVTNPSTGSRYNAAVAALNANGDPVTNESIRAMIVTLNPNDPYITPGDNAAGIQAIISGGPENDKLVVEFEVPVNQQKSELDGFEFAVQHMFGDSGFGGIVNYTVVDGDLEVDNADLGGQFALPGLSDSANIVGFYDKDGLQVRIAYNWRDKFLKQFGDSNSSRNPVYVEDYSQIDVNVSYEINENLTVFAEALNITDEYTREHGRHELMVLNVEQTGARYNFGARYVF